MFRFRRKSISPLESLTRITPIDSPFFVRNRLLIFRTVGYVQF
ncbi:unnamed protein product [Rhodiola kirilowii]